MEPTMRRRGVAPMVVLAGPLFLLLAAWLAWTSGPAPVPLRGLAEVQAEAVAAKVKASLSVEPLRRQQSAPPSVVLNGFRRDCQDCHRLFVSRDDTPRELRQHQDIRVAHGINSRCFNCHHPTDRNMLTRRDGTPLPYDREEELCSQCHGTTYRDWQNGIHGKTLGYWSAALGKPRRLICTECHDPHAPAFASYAPLPGPQTLRMGPQHGLGGEPTSVERNPLRTWSRATSHAESGKGHESP